MSKQGRFALRGPATIGGTVALTILIVVINLRYLIVPHLDQLQSGVKVSIADGGIADGGISDRHSHAPRRDRKDVQASITDGNMTEVSVFDINHQIMPHVTLRFRNKKGKVAYTYRTDASGKFTSPLIEDLSKMTVDGFLPSHYHYGMGPNMGLWEWYEYSPIATQEFMVYNRDGSPYANKPLLLVTDAKYSSELYESPMTDARGHAILTNHPAVAHYIVGISEPASKEIVVSTKRTVHNNRISYEVHLGKPATITGRVEVPLPKNSEKHYVLSCGLVDKQAEASKEFPPNADFRFDGLAPGNYVITLYPPDDGVVSEETITLKEGETKKLSPMILPQHVVEAQ